MAMETDSEVCFTCQKDKSTDTCGGCSHNFCLQHSNEHHQMLQGQLDQIITEHDQFRHTLNEHQQNLSNTSLIKQIDQWEKTSIEKVRRSAQECRQFVIDQRRKVIDMVEEQLDQFTSQLKHIREENEVNEMDLEQMTNELAEMNEELNEPSNISIQEDSSQTLIHKIHVSSSNLTEKQDHNESKSAQQECKYHQWKQHAITVTGGNGQGRQLDQLSYPCGISVDHNKNILITDHGNHRIVRWEWPINKGTIIAGGNGRGNRMDQLNYPSDVIVDKDNHSIIIADYGNKRVIRWFDQSQANQQILIDNISCWNLAMDREGFLYVSDPLKDEVRRWKEGEREGTIVAGGNGRGNQLNQLNNPYYLFVDDEQSVYVSDYLNHRVMKWRKDAKEGMVVAGGNGRGNSLNQLSHPEGLVVDCWGQIYVADRGNNRVMRWREGKGAGEIIVGGNGLGHESNQLCSPSGLSFDDERNVYVADPGNHRIQKFDLILS